MKKMRRVVAMFMCVAVVMVSLFISGVTVISPELQQAKRLTAQLFGIVNEIEKDLHKAPAYGVSEEEMEEEIINKYLYARYLKGADEQDDYILVTGNNVGYAIYDRDTMDLIEYSENSYSPFGQIKDSESFYAGPGNYLKKQNNEIEHIITKEKFDRATAKEIGKAVQNKIKLDKQRQNEKMVVEEKMERREEYSIAETTDTGISDNFLDSLLHSDEQFTITSKYISDSIYFLTIGDAYGDNQNGTCSSVATQLLLGFNNWKNDGRLIPKGTLANNERFISYDDTDISTKSKPYSKDCMITTCLYNLNDSTITFYEKLVELINTNSNGNLVGANMHQIKSGIMNYLNDYYSGDIASISMTSNYGGVEDIDNIQNEINNNRPVIVSLYLYENSQIVGSHSVVAYGYQTIAFHNAVWENGIVVHFGLPNSSNEVLNKVWINENWIRGYCSFVVSHIHDGDDNNGSPYNGDSHILICDICKRTTATSTHNYYDWDDLDSAEYDSNERLLKHLAKCNCGYEEIQEHNYGDFRPSSDETHTRICAKCKMRDTQEHWMKPSGYCMECGYYAG